MLEHLAQFKPKRLYPYHVTHTVQIPKEMVGGKRHTAVVIPISRRALDVAMDIQSERTEIARDASRDRRVASMSPERAAAQEAKWKREDEADEARIARLRDERAKQVAEMMEGRSVTERNAIARREQEEAESLLTIDNYDHEALVYAGVHSTTLAGPVDSDPKHEGGGARSNVDEEFVAGLPKQLLEFLAEQVYEHNRPAKNALSSPEA